MLAGFIHKLGHLFADRVVHFQYDGTIVSKVVSDACFLITGIRVSRKIYIILAAGVILYKNFWYHKVSICNLIAVLVTNKACSRREQFHNALDGCILRNKSQSNHGNMGLDIKKSGSGKYHPDPAIIVRNQ